MSNWSSWWFLLGSVRCLEHPLLFWILSDPRNDRPYRLVLDVVLLLLQLLFLSKPTVSEEGSSACTIMFDSWFKFLKILNYFRRNWASRSQLSLVLRCLLFLASFLLLSHLEQILSCVVVYWIVFIFGLWIVLESCRSLECQAQYTSFLIFLYSFSDFFFSIGLSLTPPATLGGWLEKWVTVLLPRPFCLVKWA